MAVLRRKTGPILLSGCIVVTLVAAAPASLSLAYQPETRLPALLAWVLLGAGVQAFTGERSSLRSTIFAALFALPLVLAALAAYGARAFWHVPVFLLALAMTAVFELFGAVLVRGLIASGSATYPYDDD